MLTVHDITERLRTHCIAAFDGGNDAEVVLDLSHGRGQFEEDRSLLPAIQRRSSSLSCKVRHRSEPAASTTAALAHLSSCQCCCSCARGIDARMCRLAVFDGETKDVQHAAGAASAMSRTELWFICDGSRDASAPAGFPPSKKPCRSRTVFSDYGSAGHNSSPTYGALQKPIAVRPAGRWPADDACRRRRLANAALSSPLPFLELGTTAACPTSPVDGCYGDRSTPPESPLLRPSSASSGFYDGSGSSLSGCSVAELAAGGSYEVAPPAQLLASPKYAAFKQRCLSVEDRVSMSSTGAAVGSAGSAMSFSAVSLPSVAAYDTVSAPSSPRRQRPPRCRSQPCDLQRERRFSGGGGVKRRREDDRPSLNFAKMTETAYERSQVRAATSCCRPKSSPVSMKCHCRQADARLSTLQTIASSPLDVTGSVMLTSPKAGFSAAPAACTFVAASRRGKSRTPSSSSSTGSGCERSPPLHICGSTPDKAAAEDNLCCFAMQSRRNAAQNSMRDDEDKEASDVDFEEVDASSVDQLFPIDLNSELDLEQIEQD